MINVEEQLFLIKKNTRTLQVYSELEDKIKEAEKLTRPLRIKLGVNPSSPDLPLSCFKQSKTIPRTWASNSISDLRLYGSDWRSYGKERDTTCPLTIPKKREKLSD